MYDFKFLERFYVKISKKLTDTPINGQIFLHRLNFFSKISL